MSRRFKLIRAIVLISYTWALLACQQPDPEHSYQPNILLLMADDWNWPHSEGIFDPNIQTPTFDRIAREGVMFQNAFVASPSCTPCRASLLTGRHPWELETGVHLWGALPAKFDVFTDILEEAGYHVGYMGKGWGPGVLSHTGRDHNPAGRIKVADFRQFFMDRPEDKPFCFWFNSSDPHRPYQWQTGIQSGMDPDAVVVPDIFPDTLETRTDICDYFFEVERFDASAGEVIRYLEEMGELDSTIVVMTGDNGMPFPRAKMTLYDLGTKVPLAIRWQERVKGGRVVEDLISLPALAPTFLEAAGIQPPLEMSARSLLDILVSEKSGLIDPQKDRVFSSIELHCGRYPMRAIRTTDYLYIRNYEPERPINLCIEYWESESGYSPTWIAVKDLPPESEIYQRVAGKRPGEELYSIKKDPYQLQNLAENPEFSGIKDQLSKDLDQELRRTGDPRILGRHEEVFYIPHSENQKKGRQEAEGDKG